MRNLGLQPRWPREGLGAGPRGWQDHPLALPGPGGPVDPSTGRGDVSGFGATQSVTICLAVLVNERQEHLRDSGKCSAAVSLTTNSGLLSLSFPMGPPIGRVLAFRSYSAPLSPCSSFVPLRGPKCFLPPD